jgi:hypothetical protein
MGEGPRPTTKPRITVGRTQVRFGYSCSAAGECAAEAVFCYTAENSYHLKAQVTSKNPQFQEEKISERRKAKSHVTSEKSSKNYISLCEGKPAKGLPTPSPHPSASHYRTFYTWWTASANRKCEIYSRDLLAGGGGGGVICETVPFVNGSSDRLQTQNQDSQYYSAPTRFA